MDVLDEPRTGSAPADVPNVSQVPIDPPATIDLGSGKPITLPDDGEVGFHKGTAEFRDEARARTVLAPLGEWLAGDTARTVTLTGTTARWGSDDYQADLSLRRADAVKALLTGPSVDPGRITVRGVGSDFPGYLDDLAEDGDLLPGPAAANRSVIVELHP